MKRSLLFLLALLMLAAGLPAALPAPASAGPSDQPPLRSTAYDGNDRVQYAHRPEFSLGAELTIEAWVYREDAGRCETIVSNDYQQSFWLGFCPDLRFYHLGSSAVDADRGLPAGQWSHVAVSYDGTTVRFYIDGEAAGSRPLAVSGAPPVRTLLLGADHNPGFLGSNYNLDGALDELRLWSRARSQAEIQAGMFAEIRSATDLVAAFGNGGDREEIAGINGTAGGATAQIVGVLPANLTIPETPITPTVDGNVNIGSEYIGAERMLLRYRNGPVLNDVAAYLVYDDDDLFVGLRFPESIAVDDRDAYIGLLLDPNGSRDEFAQADDVQIRLPFDGSAPTWLVGDGSGGWVAPASPPTPGPTTIWDTATNSCASEFAPACVEIRVSRDLFGPLSEIDNLALGHFQLNLAGPAADYLSPGQARVAAPASWAPVVYGGFSASLPRARFFGYVFDIALGSAPIAGADVYLRQGSAVLYRTTTGADGSFFFNVPVPADAELAIQLAGCSNCLYRDPVITGSGLAPTRVAQLEVTFPGCAEGTCRYSLVNFQLLEPVPPVSISSYSVDRGSPPILLRNDSPELRTDPTRVRINGSNLHELIEVYLARDILDCRQRPPRDDCERYIVPVLDRAVDGSWIEVEVPQLDGERPYGGYYWGIRDRWVRPGNAGVGTSPWIYGSDFAVVPPSFPEIYGFGFENEDDGAHLDEFLAVYGDNAYVCLGARFGDTCVGVPAPDPLYWAIWFPVFTIWIDNANGSCVGMAATSRLMERDLLSPARFDPAVRYPAGITNVGKPKRYSYETLPVFGPARAENNWAEIRKNHGVQTSSEFLAASVQELALRGPNDVLERVRARPGNFVLCVSPGLGSGHCVTPYAVEDISPTISHIRIYDNNFPGDTTRVVEIDRAANRYTFARSSGDWSGDMIYAVPISVWQEDRSMPWNVAEFLTTAVFGDADGLYSADGGEWGFRADGTPVETMPNAVSLSPAGQPASSRTAMLALPTSSPAPSAVLNTQGGGYLFHAAQGGTVLQLAADDVAAGQRDNTALRYDGTRLSSFNYAPQSARENIEPRVAMELGERARLLVRWQGLDLPGGNVDFAALRDERGVSFTNNSGSELRYNLVFEVIDGESGTAVSRSFGPFVVPNGATHTAVIADWPASTQLRSEIDLNGDGSPESSDLLTGSECSRQDRDGDGVPDLCIAAAPDSGNRVYLPLVRR